MLIDARKGVLTQTRRHSHISRLLGIRHVVVAVNKMDLVGFDADRFDGDLSRISRLGGRARDCRACNASPSSARDGDNIFAASTRMPWYDGPTLMAHLETVDVDRRHYAPAVALSGAVGEPAERGVSRLQRARSPAARVQPRRRDQRAAIRAASAMSPASSPATASSEQAIAGESVTLTLADEIDVSRGDVLTARRRTRWCRINWPRISSGCRRRCHAAGPPLCAQMRHRTAPAP